ncbi:chloride channel protein [Methanopyrus sp. SNP6]|uniref:chloride channel protein n=1 Tax=Methanopyrus sp. SNP6 TaxID=1937005 RepID=UPI0011E5A4C6|nr:chloride channel protein [Methanopyrus sp. SNP6]
MLSTEALIYVARWTVLAAALGVIGGACAVAISSIISTVEKVVGSEMLVIPAFMLLAGTLAALHPELRGTGMEIVVRGFPNEPANPIRGIAKLVLAGLVIGGGGSGGQVGPCAQACVSVGCYVASKLRMSEMERKCVVLGTISGGVAGVLCAPLAAALFAIEVIRVRSRYVVLFPSTIASLAGYSVYVSTLGKRYLLVRNAPYHYSPHHLPELLVISVVATLLAYVYSRCIKEARRLFVESVPSQPVRSLLAGLGVASVGIAIPTAVGLGLDYASKAALGRIGAEEALLSFLGKMVTTALTVGSETPAGLVSPTVCVGAFLGSFLGQTLGPSAPAGAATAIATFLAATFNAPISSAVLVIELFGIDCAVPAALGAILGYQLLKPEVVIGMKRR